MGHAPAVLLRVLSKQLGLALEFDLELVLTDPGHQLAGGGGGATIADVDARDIQLTAHKCGGQVGDDLVNGRINQTDADIAGALKWEHLLAVWPGARPLLAVVGLA